MISPVLFIQTLQVAGINFFAGVPDSLLKSVCAYITDHLDANHHVITANEGAAVALAAGHYLATGQAGCVYMQNSGEGNAINPLASLTDGMVYGIPVLLLVGWRGQPGVHDEPQHAKQGQITLPLLDVMGIDHAVLSDDNVSAIAQVATAIGALCRGESYALVVTKDCFEPYALQQTTPNTLPMSREEAIGAVLAQLGERDVVVSTTGMTSRELFELREGAHQGHERDFLTVGSMGHASQVALGIALAQPDRRVWCLDGDGATLMHMGSLAIVGTRAGGNYVHVVFNNGAHDSVGGQPTVGLHVDLAAAAAALGYRHTMCVTTRQDLDAALQHAANMQGPVMIEVRVRRGNRKDLGRPTTTPKQNKEALMHFLAD